MAKNPQVQRKAQEEIDRVVGTGRLPDVNDRPDLPYIEAIYRELLRYEPPLTIGIPHSLLEDDVVNGYFIPRGLSISGQFGGLGMTYNRLGSFVYSNIWAMTHDENVYPDPFTFKPERFFDADGKLNDDNRVLAYGFGRRSAF
jgi:cytochrome P450